MFSKLCVKYNFCDKVYAYKVILSKMRAKKLDGRGVFMNFNCKVEQKQFCDKNGEIVKYFTYTVELFGNVITLKPDEASKRLANYLLKENFKEDK